MSKSFSLAGLRVGFAIGSEDIVGDLWAVKDSYNLGRLPLAAATAALQDMEYWRSCVEQTVANRERLTPELRNRGYDVLPSGSNFVFAIPPTDASAVQQSLMEQRVLVRHFPTTSAGHGLRITVGTWDQCQALLAAVDRIAS
jgi:histidinol-phosphate aminotransferase